MREHKSIFAGIIVLALVIAGMFVFAYLKKKEITEAPVVTPKTEETVSPYKDITRIEGKHFFQNGTHTVVGEIPFPTACDLLNWDARIAESMPEQVTIAFDVVNNSDSCAQVVTSQRFKVSFSASENASIRATLENRQVELNLVPALPGESPDDFELFIKG